MVDNYWSDKFNALPKDVRIIACAINGETHIRQIQSTKQKLIRAHKRHIAELNEQIKNIEAWQKSEFPVPPLEGNTGG